MKVVLVRHGEPDFEAKMWVGVDSVRAALARYRNSRVFSGPGLHLPDSKSTASVHFMSSGLPRAKDSVRLYQNAQAEVSELLNESELPHPDTLYFPCPWSFLIVFCRLRWFFGYRSNAAGLHNDKERASRASDQLINRAVEYGSVYAFGHGIMNRLISRELQTRGWKVHSKTGHGYWSSITLVFHQPDCL